MYVTAEKHVYI